MIADRCFGCMEVHSGYPCPRCGYSPGGNPLIYALKPGTILNGKYLVGRVLGQGGFGITYIGWDLQLERKVAIKEFYPSGHVTRQNGTGLLIWHTNDEAQTAMRGGQEMFLKEARKMSRVRDISQVVRVRSVFQENDTAYICMDFIGGQTLKDRLKSQGKLTWEQAKGIFLPVMDAMEQVHKAGLIHRDLSPDNLMVQPDGTVKILDLGAAKDLNLNSGKTSMQVAKSGFSPLEQYMQQGNSGSWTDVYALAATMYYSLTGVMPPSAIDRMDKDSLDWELPELKALPPEALAALKRAMVLRSEKRTQTMAEFSAQIQKKKPEPVKKPKQPPVKKEPKPPVKKKPKAPVQKEAKTQKKKWPILAAAAAIALCGVLVMGLGGEKPKAQTGAQPQESEAAEARLEKKWQDMVDRIRTDCQLETYLYQDGSRMDMYFDEEDREHLRIYVNTGEEEEFIFLAEYNARGDMVGRYGFQDLQLMRSVTWVRDARGNPLEIEVCDGSGQRISHTLITYDDQGREISRLQKDALNTVLLEASSTYDQQGREVYSGKRSSGESFVYAYDAQGNLENAVSMDAQGQQIGRTVYHYDSQGRETEALSYDGEAWMTYRVEYRYEDDLRIGETAYSYYEDTEFVTEYNMIYGPRNTLMGRENLDADFGGITEDIEAMDGTWLLRSITHYSGEGGETNIAFYNWNTDYLGNETYDADKNLTYKSETQFDSAGRETGSISTTYDPDGGYTISRMDRDYNGISDQSYDSSGKLIREREYLYDDAGESRGAITREYAEDGSLTETEMDENYNTLVSRNYDAAGELVSQVENRYDEAGNWTGSVSTLYYYDGSYMVTEKDANYKVISQNTYDADGNLIKSE